MPKPILKSVNLDLLDPSAGTKSGFRVSADLLLDDPEQVRTEIRLHLTYSTPRPPQVGLEEMRDYFHILLQDDLA